MSRTDTRNDVDYEWSFTAIHNLLLNYTFHIAYAYEYY